MYALSTIMIAQSYSFCLSEIKGCSTTKLEPCLHQDICLHFNYMVVQQQYYLLRLYNTRYLVYYAWLNKNELDDTKSYRVEEQYYIRESLQESFHWIRPETVEELNRRDPDGKYYKLRALTANISMNKNDYRDVQKLMMAAKSLGWRPLNIDHDHNQ